MKIEESSKHNYSITDNFNTNFYTITSGIYKIPIKVPIIPSNYDAYFVKELYLDIATGKEFKDLYGNKYKLDVKNIKKRKAVPRVEYRDNKKFIFYTNVTCTDIGVCYYTDTGKPVKMSDSNGILNYKETLTISGTNRGVGVKPYELCLQAFADDTDAIKKIKSIWYYNENTKKPLKFNIKSPAKSDSGRASCKPIICKDTGECYFNERQFAFAELGIPNIAKKYPKDLIIHGHQFREPSFNEYVDIYNSYFEFRNNAPKEIRENRCVYTKFGAKGEVLTLRDTTLNMET